MGQFSVLILQKRWTRRSKKQEVWVHVEVDKKEMNEAGITYQFSVLVLD